MEIASKFKVPPSTFFNVVLADNSRYEWRKGPETAPEVLEEDVPHRSPLRLPGFFLNTRPKCGGNYPIILP
jgi:hypothetical protein